MKNDEFKRQIEELGFEVIGVQSVTFVVTEGNHFAQVDEKLECVMSIGYNIFHRLSTEVRAKLFDILVEYAKTPIQERKDEKKYSIYPIRTMAYKLVRFEAIYRECGYEDEDSFGISSAPYLNKGTSVVFTESEAKEICDFFGWDFRKVAEEVGDDE